MGFEFDTYVVLDVPMPVAAQIMAVREHHRDEFRASLPVEITVAGSSGIGVFDPSQDSEAAFATLDSMAAEIAPIHASFGQVIRFPDTDIFVLTLNDERPFRALHECIAKSGLHFLPNSFPYKPHCTLRSRSPVSEEDAKDLLALQIVGDFVLDSISVYMMDKLPVTLLHRVKLTGSGS